MNKYTNCNRYMEKKVIDPVSVDLIKAELTPDKKLCDTNKAGNELYVFDWRDAPNTLREVGRLREIAFRDGGGGTGEEVDLDDFDFDPEHPYKQIVVWDPDANAILGGYRFILGPDVQIQEDGQPHITSAHMFHYSEQFIRDYLPHTMELGRSFVAPEYQSSKAGAKAIFALDNLWDGIVAVILQHPGIIYFLGKMTIYPDYDRSARELIQHFLWKHFPDPDVLARPKHPVEVETDPRLLDLILRDDEYKQDYRNLKDAIRRLGLNIPPLVNSYMNISPTMKMLGTGVNDEFFNCFDTGIMVCYDEIYAEKQERHREPYFRHLAKKIRIRFPGMRAEPEEVAQRYATKNQGDRMRRFSEFLNRQKDTVMAAEKNLRKKVLRKKKKEKVEP